MMPIPTKLTCGQLVWVLLPVLAMGALFHILLLIFTRVNSKFVAGVYINYFQSLTWFKGKKILTTPFVKPSLTTLKAYTGP
jgi:hypothetical protein